MGGFMSKSLLQILLINCELYKIDSGELVSQHFGTA